MAVLVPLGHQGVGVLGGQGGVDVRLAVLPAQEEAGGRRPLGGLVVDVLDFTGAVLVAEHVLGVVDARVQEAQQDAPAFQVQIGLPVDLGNPRRLQGGAVHQAQHHGDGADEGRPQGLLQLVEVLRLHVAQDVAPREHLPHHNVVGAVGVVKEGVGGPGDEVHRVRRVDELQNLRSQLHGQSPLSRWLASASMEAQRFSRP